MKIKTKADRRERIHLRQRKRIMGTGERPRLSVFRSVLLLAWAAAGKLDFSRVVTRTVPLEAEAINGVLDELERFGDSVRVVVTPV